MSKPDIRFEIHGSVTRFVPLTARADRWIKDEVSYEDWQWFGDALCVEPRYAGDLLEGAMSAGLEISQ